MEYRGALAAGKPIIFVLETDPAHGGVPIKTHLDELARAEGDHWKNDDGTDDAVARGGVGGARARRLQQLPALRRPLRLR